MAQTNKPVKTRIVHKHEKAENWAAATNFTPLSGELIVYEYEKGETPRLKIGDGETNVNELPFIDDSLVTKDEAYIKSENGSFATGENTTASGVNSSAEGKNTVASGMNSHTEGYDSQATGYGAHAENGQTKAIGAYSHAQGYLSKAEGDNSCSEGMKTKAIGNNSHASGQETKAEGANSFSAGHATHAIGNNSFTTGAETKALTADTFVAGLLAKAGGKAFQVSSRIDMPPQNGLAVGGYVVNSMTGLQALFDEAAAQGQMLYYIAHIEANDYYELGNVVDITSMPNTIIGAGIGVTTLKSDVEKAVIPSVGSYLMVMGCPELGDMEVGLAAFAEGVDTRAQHYGAHVEGISAIAAGPGAHGEGILTRAVHFGSHAQGFSTIAGGAYSHAGGYASEAGADHAFAHGEKLYAYGKNQTVVGQYNKIDNDALFIVGGGDSEENRKNLFVVKKDGSIIGLNTSNALTKTVSGEVIRIDDASPIEHEMDVKVRGKNLIPTNAYVTSGGEMSIENSSITLTKKATGNPPSIIWELGAYKDFVGKTLTISFVLDAMGSSGGTNGSATIHIQCGNVTKETVEAVNAVSYTNEKVGTTITKTFTVPVLDDNGRQLCIRHYMNNGNTEGDYITISNIQIEEGSTATAYTPYIEDIGAVKVKKLGKNILPYPYSRTTPLTTNGITFTPNEDRSVTISGVASGNAYCVLWNADLGKKNMVGVASGGTNGDYAFSPYMNYSGSNHNVSVFVVKGTDLTTPVTIYPQIEKGTVVTLYEPYIEPIEYPVSADGVVEGVSPYSDTTTLMTDTAGAIINCTYNRDINRVLDDTGFMYDNNPVGTGSFSMNRKVGSEVGDYSFTEGYSAAAAGKYSHAGGEASQAKGIGSFAHGQRVTADADYQATFGTHNEVNNTAAFVIGNGNETTKSNAFEVQKDGNAFVKGSLYIGGAGSSAVSAQEVATAEAVSLIDRRITKVEDILASSSGEFIEDSDVAYAKVVPENVAQYASLNKVGGLGIRQSNFVNLFPATYDVAKGSTYDYYTFTYDNNGIITITDATPLENWDYEPYFSAQFDSLCDVELAAGTYTLTFEAEGAPFALRTGINGESVQIGGYWDGEGLSSPYTFTLTEDSTLSFDLGFACGGSYYCPPGEPTDFTYRVMLNKGSNALPWKAPSALGNDAPYIEPPKVTSIDVIGKNVFDYGAPRALGGEFYDEYPGYYYQANVTEEGAFILETLVIEGEVGPETDVGETFTLELEGINTTRVYPAGAYSISSPVMCGSSEQDEVYLALSIKLLNSGTTRTNLMDNITIEEPFIITRADIVYKPATATSYIGGVSIPLTLAYGASPLDEFVPFDCKTLQIPEAIVSRDDYGLGVSNSRTLFSNYIDFEEEAFVKKCLSMVLTGTETEFYTHLTTIDIDTIDGTMHCSDPSLTCEFSQYGPEWGCFRVYFENPGDAEDYVAGLYANGTPVQMFFGTTIREKINISAELAGIDNYLAVESGGLIIFNNDQQAAIPSTIEYQSTLIQGEVEEL